VQVYGKNLTAAMVQTVTFLFFKVKDKNSLLSTLRCVPTDAAMDGAQVGSSAAAAKPRPTAANSKKAKGKGKAKPKSKGKGKSAAHSDSDSDSTSDGWADTPKRKKPRHSGSDSGNFASDAQFNAMLAACGGTPVSPTATLQSELTGLYNLRALCPEDERADFDPMIAHVKAQLLSGLGIASPPAAVATEPQVRAAPAASGSGGSGSR
jgi:hypothetical protein